MAPLLFKLTAVNSDVDADSLTFFSYSETTQTADMTIFHEFPLADFKGIKVKVNNDQFDSANPENNDLNIKFTTDFFDGPLKNLFSNTFEIATQNTTVSSTTFPNAVYISRILSDTNFKIEHWEELAVSGLIEKILGDYKKTPMVSNEDAVVATLPANFNNAINQKLTAGKAKVSNNGVFTEYDIASEAGNDFKNSVATALKKVLGSEPARLTSALNSAGTYVDFNTGVFSSGDLIEIIMNLNANYNQFNLDKTTYYTGPGVVVRVILKLVAPVIV